MIHRKTKLWPLVRCVPVAALADALGTEWPASAVLSCHVQADMERLVRAQHLASEQWARIEHTLALRPDARTSAADLIPPRADSDGEFVVPAWLDHDQDTDARVVHFPVHTTVPLAHRISHLALYAAAKQQAHHVEHCTVHACDSHTLAQLIEQLRQDDSLRIVLTCAHVSRQVHAVLVRSLDDDDDDTAKRRLQVVPVRMPRSPRPQAALRVNHSVHRVGGVQKTRQKAPPHPRGTSVDPA